MRGRDLAIAVVAGVAVATGVVVAVVQASGEEAVVFTGLPADLPTPPVGAATIVAVGDIGRCDGEHDEATARLVEGLPDATVLALGDLAYDDGSARDFDRCYDPAWGAFRDRTRPVPGNHEYHTPHAAAYFDYFGSRAGEPGEGWYSFDLGEWHIVALNSNCDAVGCDDGSPQERWLRADLERSGAECTLAYWHHPRFTSGARHGGTDDVEDLWAALVDHDVELVLSGHEHVYERTAPLDADGAVDDEHGVRQFVVGTGGGNFYEVGERIPGSEAAVADTSGVLLMQLLPGGYDFQFLPASEGGPADQGSADCR